MKEVLTEEKCYHCGDKLPDKVIAFDNRKFCCNGCQTVYEILNQHELTGYYDIENAPGIRKKPSSGSSAYEWLDNEDMGKKILSFYEGSTAKATFYIPEIHCSSCIYLLENLYKLHSGIYDARVNFSRKEATITFSLQEISLRSLAELLDSLGYGPRFNLESVSGKKKNTEKDRGLIYKIGVAGFAFGNIMLLSFPEYLGLSSDSQAFNSFFGYINLFLALPVLIYCSRGYLTSAYKVLRYRMVNLDVPIALGILVLFGRSAWEVLSQTGPGYFDSFAGLLFFLLIGKWYQGKTYDALSFERDYQSYFPVSVRKVVEGKEVPAPLDDLKAGDIICIRNEEIIPADSSLLSGTARIDYSFVNGESEPVRKDPGDQIFAGGKQKGEAIRVKVEKPVNNSYLISLWNQKEFSKTGQEGVSSLINQVGRWFTYGVLALAVGTAVLWLFIDPSSFLHPVTSVLIVACPCALALTLPFALGNTIRLFGMKGFFLKNASVVENIASADVIVFDKTGTLTEAENGRVAFVGHLENDDKHIISALTKNSLHPLSQKVSSYIDITGDLPLVEDYAEITGKGIQGVACDSNIKLGSSDFVGEKDAGAINESRVYYSKDGKVKGYFTVRNLYRENVLDMITELKRRKELYLLSGDNESERGFLSSYFSPEQIFFNQAPIDKMNFIRKLKASGKRVVMIGDGLNDAGALKAADAGISVTENVQNFTPSSDGILKADLLPSLAHILSSSEKSMNVVRAGLLISLLYNVVGVSFAVTGMLSPVIAAILMPLSSVTVVVFASLGAKLSVNFKRTR